MRRIHVLLVASVLAALLVTAAGMLTGDSAPGESRASGPHAAIDWHTPGVVQVGSGWRLEDEEGDGPFVSVVRNGKRVGVIEILGFALDTLPEVTAALPNGTRSALNAHVAAFLASFASDRAAGCGVDYQFTPDPVEHTQALDGPVVRYGFRGTMPDGAPSERVIHWAGVRGEFLVLLTASAHDAGGCVPPEGTEFSTDDLDTFAPLFERVVLASRLPTPGPQARPHRLS